MKTQIITIAAIKGGTGKTATAGALAQAAAHSGQKVLVIDLDPQASLSIWQRADLTQPNSYDLLENRIDIRQTIQQTGKDLYTICSGAILSALHAKKGSEKRLLTALRPIQSRYDLIIIDTAPRMDEGLNNALYASNGLIIPVETDGSGIQALYQILDTAKHIQQTQQRLQITGVVITKYDGRPNINRFMLDRIRDTAEKAGIPLLTTIRQGIAIREAMALQSDLFDYAPNSNPAQDYSKLLDIITQEKE